MSSKDQEIIEKLIKENEEFRRYMEEHRELEKKVAELEKKLYLTPDEEMEVKRLKKIKLAGKDKIEEMISRYKKGMMR